MEHWHFCAVQDLLTVYIVIQKSSAVFPIVKEHKSVVNEGIVEGNLVFQSVFERGISQLFHSTKTLEKLYRPWKYLEKSWPGLFALTKGEEPWIIVKAYYFVICCNHFVHDIHVSSYMVLWNKINTWLYITVFEWSISKFSQQGSVQVLAKI